MIMLYPRPWRPARLEIAWKTWRDLHPRAIPGYDLLKVTPVNWWKRFIRLSDGRGFIGLHLGFGSLVIVWRRGGA